MKKSFLILFVICLTAVLFAGCGSKIMDDTKSDISSVTDEMKDKTDSMMDDMAGDGNYDNSGKVSGAITKDDALTKALDHAGVKKENVYDIDIEHEMQNGRYVYDIDFDTPTNEYSYDIDSDTGEIISSSKENK